MSRIALHNRLLVPGARQARLCQAYKHARTPRPHAVRNLTRIFATAGFWASPTGKNCIGINREVIGSGEVVPAYKSYTWDYIAPNQAATVFLHGYPSNMAFVYSAVGYALTGEVFNPVLRFTLNQGEIFRHVDNTFARKPSIQNNAPFNSIRVELHVLYDTF